MGISYRNTTTGDVVTFPARRPRLERLSRWERVDGAGGVPAAADTSGAPPKIGRGSGRSAWAEYAEAQGIDVTGDMSREDIWELLEA